MRIVPVAIMTPIMNLDTGKKLDLKICKGEVINAGDFNDTSSLLEYVRIKMSDMLRSHYQETISHNQ